MHGAVREGARYWIQNRLSEVLESLWCGVIAVVEIKGVVKRARETSTVEHDWDLSGLVVLRAIMGPIVDAREPLVAYSRSIHFQADIDLRSNQGPQFEPSGEAE